MRPLRLLCIGMVLVILVAGCRKHDPEPPGPAVAPTGVVRLKISPTWDGAPFDKQLQYTNVSDHRVLIQMVKFYLGDLVLSGPTGTTTLTSIDLFDITNGPQEGHYTAVPGIYDLLDLGVGVPYDLNHSDPSNYANEHPLSGSNGMYWTWASRYRFVIFDGRYDTVAGTGVPPYVFSIHTGFDTCYRALQLPLSSILVADDDTVELELEVDLEQFFHNSTDTLVLNQTPQWHGEPDQLGTGLKLSDLVRDAISAP